ncbi:F510_1955 family glycosylhydrolase [Gorillibacterium sp. sgz5001074]|uniref:F510_1955 family glycosylhydrolase n=1 Tax=Gorillibacterium sp. sgz5001074 TaxID=3446695 RepID=UPI003F669259
MKGIYRAAAPAAAAALAGGGTAYANGEDSTAASAGIAWYIWVVAVLCAVTVILTAVYWIRRHRPEGRWLKGLSLLAGTGAVLMGAFVSSGMWQEDHGSAPMNLIHIHGLTYDGSGSRIMLATHDGIKYYSDGEWTSGDGERHDYMGFAPYDGGFYSSGHPVSGSKLQNPLGLVKSTDEGKSIQILALHGQVDFHLLGVSYRNPVIYAYNPAPNETLKQPGLYVTKDDGKSWTLCPMTGFAGEPTALAVHPENGDIIAVGSRDGLFLSKDQGKSFEKLLKDTGISALGFDRDGQLTVGGFKEKPSLLQLDPTTRKLQEVPLPELKEDAVAYTGHHPSNPKERIITTYDQDVYLTTDGGETWMRLADNGKTKPEPELLPKAEKKTS